jgi:hypothetical protein
MSQSFARFAGRRLVLLAVAFNAGACMATQHVALDSRTDLHSASGITTHSGRKISFTTHGASIANDTLYAMTSAGPLIMPTDSIATISRKKFSAIRTLGLVGGAFAGLLLVAFIGLATSGTGFLSQ